MRTIESATAVRTGGDFAQRVLLRAGAGERGEPGLDAAAGRTAPGPSGLWDSALDGVVAARGSDGQPEAGGPASGVDGDRGGISAAVVEPAGSGTPDLPVPLERLGYQRSGPGVVQRHHVCAAGLRVH